MSIDFDHIQLPELKENQKCYAGIPEANFVVSHWPIGRAETSRCIRRTINHNPKCAHAIYK